ncbi:hypothetical protein C8R45DRAFT_1030089, partial [Mycena sanguinolenta]
MQQHTGRSLRSQAQPGSAARSQLSRSQQRRQYPHHDSIPSDDELSGQRSHSYSDDDSLTLDAVPALEQRYGFIGRGPPPRPQSNTQDRLEYTATHHIDLTPFHYTENTGVPFSGNRYRSNTLPRRAATQPVRSTRSTAVCEDPIHSPDTGERSRGGLQLEHLFEQLLLKQEQIIQQQDRHHQELQQENRLLHVRLASLELAETHAAPPEPTPTGNAAPARRPARGLKATRGSATTRARAPEKRSQCQTIPAPVVAEPEAAPREVSDGDSADREHDDGQAARIIQSMVTSAFRKACDVAGNHWPDPALPRTNDATGELYLTPFFDFDVAYPANNRIFRAVAKKVESQLNSSLPPGVEKSDVPTFGTLTTMAKVSFRGFKKNRKRTVDDAVAQRAEVNARTLRHFRRRETKLSHIQSQIVPYSEERGIDATVLGDMIVEQHLSDEASGPEDDEETSDAWKMRMAVKYKISDLSIANLKNHRFLEVSECPWRSETYSDMLHDMLSMWDASLTPKERANMKYLRMRGTHRLSSRVPTIAPYDFGISLDWLKQHQDDTLHGPLLRDWNTYGKTDGFDAWKLNQHEKTAEGPAAEEEGADGLLTVQEGA